MDNLSRGIRMYSLHIQLWLFWFLTAIHEIRGELCRPGWIYHDHSGSCLRLESEDQLAYMANSFCSQYKTVGYKNITGHLVYIFNKQTDDFVKGLLSDADDSALIGLQDRDVSGRYVWGESVQKPVSYTGWAKTPHVPDSDHDKNYVIITKKGWEECLAYSTVKFVCQMDAEFPRPEMTCLRAQIGKPSPSIDCIINFPDVVNLTELSFERGRERVVSCDRQTCRHNQVYEISINRKKLGQTRIWSSTLKIKKVETSDEGDWSCHAKFSNDFHVASSPCSLKVYNAPEKIDCVERFVQSTLEVTCSAVRSHQQEFCSWNIYKDSLHQVTDFEQTFTSGTTDVNGTAYYSTACKVSFNVTTAGIYRFNVSMSPYIRWLNSSLILPTTTQELNVTVAPPLESPVLLDSSGSQINSTLELTENLTVSITCRISGGTPPVHKTQIFCFNALHQTEAGQSLKMAFNTSRNLHGQTCSCWGNHITGTTKTVVVKILIKLPAKVTSFSLQGHTSGTDIQAGQEVTMNCTTNGYPQAQMSLMLYTVGGQNLSVVIGHELTHTVITTCRATGRYVCLAQNVINNIPYKDSKYVDIRVPCPPEYCHLETPGPRCAVVVDTDSTFQVCNICVLAYPAPTSFILYRDWESNSTDEEVEDSRYSASFEYTDQARGLGEITINITSFALQDLGYYQLYSEYRQPLSNTSLHHSYVKFEIFAQGPPNCPANFTVDTVSSDSVTLSWEPGFDGGLPQTFIVLCYDASGNISSSRVDHVMLHNVEHTSDVFSYNITGLSENTFYRFGLQVENYLGSQNCSHTQVSATTLASTDAPSGHNLAMIVAPVITGLILFGVAAAVCVVWIRHRQAHAPPAAIYAADIYEENRDNYVNTFDVYADYTVGLHDFQEQITPPISSSESDTYLKRVHTRDSMDYTEPSVSVFFRRSQDSTNADIEITDARTRPFTQTRADGSSRIHGSDSYLKPVDERIPKRHEHDSVRSDRSNTSVKGVHARPPAIFPRKSIGKKSAIKVIKAQTCTARRDNPRWSCGSDTDLKRVTTQTSMDLTYSSITSDGSDMILRTLTADISMDYIDTSSKTVTTQTSIELVDIPVSSPGNSTVLKTVTTQTSMDQLDSPCTAAEGDRNYQKSL